MTRADESRVHGTVADGFEPVREAFAENLARRNELGAACAVYHRNEKVVDLWGGYRDTARTQPWTEDTQVLVFSTTKGMAATALALAHSRGHFDWDDRVGDYWPDFGKFGKYDVTVAELLTHRAGLAAPDHTFRPEEVADREFMAETLAAQEPNWEPGTRHGYHAITLGWYESELLRRAEGRTLGEFWREEIQEPLDLEFHLGTAEDVAAEHAAELKDFAPLSMVRHLGSMPVRLVGAFFNPRSLTARALGCLDVTRPGQLNEPRWREVPMPSADGIGEVRAIAAVYGDLATGAERVGIDDETLAAIHETPAPPSGGARDLVLKVDATYSTGFTKPSSGLEFGTSDAAFGAPGTGGSFGFADPDADLGFAYAPNRLGYHLKDDPRALALREAVYSCLD